MKNETSMMIKPSLLLLLPFFVRFLQAIFLQPTEALRFVNPHRPRNFRRNNARVFRFDIPNENGPRVNCRFGTLNADILVPVGSIRNTRPHQLLFFENCEQS